MARLLQLNDTQEGVLNIVFKVADEQGLLLLDFKDLQAVLQWTAENAGTLTTKYGNVSKQTVGTIQRALLTLEQQGGERFFGEPALDLKDMIGRDASGAGYINVLAADKLMQSPRLYATFLLWLLSELFEVMPEVGDLDRPKFVFFFDEAHLLFDDAPKALLDKIEQVVRLIRSKGVGVYFITQNPLDIPESVLGQLSNRVQHALRAFTPQDQKAVKTAAETFRPNKKFDAAAAIVELGVGEALVSFLDAKGVPSRSSAASSPRRAAASARRPTPSAPPRSRRARSPASTTHGRSRIGLRGADGPGRRRPGRARRGGPAPSRVGAASTMPRRRRRPIAACVGPWGRTRIPQTEPAQPKPKPRLREAQPAPPPPSPPPPREPKAPARRSDTISDDDHQVGGRTVANVPCARRPRRS